jgi:hypothetical protein
MAFNIDDWILLAKSAAFGPAAALSGFLVWRPSMSRHHLTQIIFSHPCLMSFYVHTDIERG